MLLLLMSSSPVSILSMTDCCDKLFEQFNSFADSAKRKAAVWPLEMMLLVLCPVSRHYSATWCCSCQPGTASLIYNLFNTNYRTNKKYVLSILLVVNKFLNMFHLLIDIVMINN